MQIPFTKMQGTGNDFVVVNNISLRWRPTPTQLRQIADRHFGIGCDQILLLEGADETTNRFTLSIYNADGSPAEQCGNGLRCMARFIAEQQLTAQSVFWLVTLAGTPHRVELNPDSTVTLELTLRTTPEHKCIPYTQDRLSITAVNVGNPHAVIQVTSVDQAPLAAWGEFFNAHPDFPRGMNVSCMEIITRTHIKLRVFERGVGETLACGSGACAAVIAGQLQNRLDQVVTVQLPGGWVKVAWQAPEAPIKLTGTAMTVFTGTINL